MSMSPGTDPGKCGSPILMQDTCQHGRNSHHSSIIIYRYYHSSLFAMSLYNIFIYSAIPLYICISQETLLLPACSLPNNNCHIKLVSSFWKFDSFVLSLQSLNYGCHYDWWSLVLVNFSQLLSLSKASTTFMRADARRNNCMVVMSSVSRDKAEHLNITVAMERQVRIVASEHMQRFMWLMLKDWSN